MKPFEQMRGLIGDTIYARTFGPKPAGWAGPRHLHHIEHVTLVMQGTAQLKIWPEGQLEGDPEQVIEIEAPNFVVAPADKHHQFSAVTDDLIYICIFSQDEGEAHLETATSPRLQRKPRTVFSSRRSNAPRP